MSDLIKCDICGKVADSYREGSGGDIQRFVFGLCQEITHIKGKVASDDFTECKIIMEGRMKDETTKVYDLCPFCNRKIQTAIAKLKEKP